MAAVVVLASCGTDEPRMFPDTPRDVPPVTGQSVRDASAQLESDGFGIRLQRRGSPDDESLDPATCRSAIVVAQDPLSDAKVMRATTVTVTVERCP